MTETFTCSAGKQRVQAIASQVSHRCPAKKMQRVYFVKTDLIVVEGGLRDQDEVRSTP